ncbi:hypothetical protein DQ04_11911010 [Trypanosoma grayi]|uniref:hypothetical protein n=1 Tax=Trypanosoma grayi TaxID=71804 RepID=UPI0004F4A433|nr:hypothetical protein DQ04_11911010 [Trypanosoma grayi]KEG06857.1 hypothetical protein DQ04_11911010 [Trypanosoma grayi]
MSEGLLTQWRDRVVEAETEVSVVQEDINALLKQRKEIKLDIVRYDKLVQKEKQEMLSRLEEVETQARELEESCQKTLQQKTRVEEMYVQTLDNYESLHEVVKAIQKDEEDLQSREDVEAVLQRESLAWAEEEHALRTKLNTIQSAMKVKRKQRQEEMSTLEAQLAGAERQLQQVRHERQGQAQQQVYSAKPSRRGTPLATTQRPSTAVGAAPEAAQKEQQFIAANASTSVPTRQLRSCMKNSNATMDSYQHGDHKTQLSSSGNGPAVRYQSAPVSRAASQALVAGDDGDDSVVAGLSTPHRAYSYVSGKKAGGRKRDVLGDATNR